MKPMRTVVLVALVLVLILVLVWFRLERPTEPAAVEEIPVAALVEPEAPIRHPLPELATIPAEAEEEGIPPLPEPGQSDPFVQALLRELFGETTVRKLLSAPHFLPRMMIIIDALPRRDLPLQHLPVTSPRGSFQVADGDDGALIASANFARYAPYVELAESVPARHLAQSYLRVYPLLDQIYREMGHPDGYFHDRMIAVLDHLLATPRVEEPILLEEHIARYRYADPQLEALSAGQKILIRMGSHNADRIKAVLAELRRQLTVASKPPAARN